MMEGGSLDVKCVLFPWEGSSPLLSALAASVWHVLAALRSGGQVWRVPQAAGAHPPEGRADSEVEHAAHVSGSRPLSCSASEARLSLWHLSVGITQHHMS